MTDTRTARCEALYRVDARPLLAAVAAARVAGRPIRADWQCTRRPHADPDDQHLAQPLGRTGPAYAFAGLLVEPPPAPDCSNLACQHSQADHDDDGSCRLCPCPPYDVPDTAYALPCPADTMPPCPADTGPSAGPALAAADLAELVERLARAGAGVVRCEPGDTLLVLVPDLDAGEQPEPGQPSAAEVYAEQLGRAVPGVAVLVLAGVAGAVVVPAHTAG
jgi:hypothetical protein